MKTMIYEIGVIDKAGNKHPVSFNEGLNVVTGKSSTGKSALIEIFDYCFGSDENTIPKGVITDSAEIYYVALSVDSQDMVFGRDPNQHTKAFFRRMEDFQSDQITREYFNENYFLQLAKFKKHVKEFFLDFDDVDESLAAREARGKKAPTPSIRSFVSLILQHQNLVANKHALFYRFDEKEKRDQVIEHTKIFLSLVDQKYFHLSQEKERITTEVNKLKRQKEAGKRANDAFKARVGPVLANLYALMGISEYPITIEKVLRAPADAKEQLDKIIVADKINHNSDATVQRYNELKLAQTKKTAELRKLQRESSSITKHIQQEQRFVENVSNLTSPDSVQVSAVICPFCHTEKDSLTESAENLQKAVEKVTGNLSQARPMKAKFESSLIEIKRKQEICNKELLELTAQISELEKNEKKLSEQKSLYENILMQKAKLFMLLDTLNLADDSELNKQLNDLNDQLKQINKELRSYNVKEGLNNASQIVNEYMAEIGKNFEFEASYKPTNLNFSFETFDLYHLTPNEEKIYLRSMGSGANWLYSHLTLFLALHKYFTELGDKCAIPSLLFFDQPTQVYFPNFNRDNSGSFEEQKTQEAEQREISNIVKKVDEDIVAVENLFSQFSIYCNELKKLYGFCPQIIVTDHADDLKLSNGVDFESLVNGNRWRTRGLIDPQPQISVE